VAIVGGGFGGIGMAARLLTAGFSDVTLFEQAPALGGVWHHNTYPGAACDVPSALYSFAFAPNPRWSRRFSPQSEIQQYLGGVAARFGVDRHALLGTEVHLADYDEDRCAWVLETSQGHFVADLLVAACGQLTQPSVPTIPGLQDFAGPVVHTARWDGSLEFEGRRVAVLGTGASAIQAVPELAKVAASLDIFQRDAPWILPKPDRAYRPWQQILFDRVPAALRAERGAAFWLNEVATAAYTTHPRIRPALAALSHAYRRLAIKDPHLRALVAPTDAFGCKRVLLSNDWYRTLSQAHVELITSQVTRVDREGPVLETGERRPADVIVLGTGFKAQQFVAPMRVAGRNGTTLDEAWSDRPRAHLGTTIPGFPNLFLLYGPNTNVGAGSVVYMLEAAMRQVVAAAEHLHRTGSGTIEVKPDAAAQFDRDCQRALRRSVWATGCASWYLNDRGDNPNNWPWSAREYRRRLEQLDLDAFDVRRAAEAHAPDEARAAS
jgi:cation diffusion facilitator CzcD-associated flavoprotein CzcO